jgi:hypothetical protein
VGFLQTDSRFGRPIIPEISVGNRDIAALFEGQPLSGIPETFCLSVKIEPVFAQEHFEQLRQFTSVLTLTFKVWG